jgi:hypothetical protein
MTVDELRRKLAGLPADADVFVYHNGYAAIADLVRTPVIDTPDTPVRGFVIIAGETA